VSARSVLEWLRRLRDRYYKTKYLWLGRLLGRKDLEADLSRRGLLVIQIDGLSYETLQLALQKRYCPFLRRLSQRGFQLQRYNCGLPSNTPTAHAVLFYGDRDETPAFRWYERETGRHINFFNPIDAGTVEARLSKKHPDGLLAGGSSYSNTFSGSAARAVLCYGSATDSNYGRKLRGFHILLIMLLNIVPILRAFALSVYELFAELFEWLASLLRRLPQRVEFLFPITRIIESVWVQEIVTQGALLEIVRGSPAIYVTYLAYDTHSHQRGCNRPFSLRKLVSIDRRLRKIVRLAQRHILRPYDVYILSDHGQAPSTPFLYRYGEELEEYISRVLHLPPGEEAPPLADPPSHVSLVLRSLEPYERNFVRGAQWLVRKFRRFVLRRVGRASAGRRSDHALVVAVSGPMAHVYLPAAERLSDRDIAQRYPQLIASLLQHPGIGVVAALQDGRLILHSQHGQAAITEAGRIEGDDVLKDHPEKDFNAPYLRRVAMHQHAGDLIVFGALHDGEVINFEHHMSTHGGIGGQQQSAFILHPSTADVPDTIDSFESIRAMMLATRRRSDTRPPESGASEEAR